jgi:MoaA/NifB/PqqE/SkfB family radical SAM enzyme
MFCYNYYLSPAGTALSQQSRKIRKKSKTTGDLTYCFRFYYFEYFGGDFLFFRVGTTVMVKVKQQN